MSADTIGARIKTRREALGMSQEELAEKMSMNRSTICRYERNEISDIKLAVLEKLAIQLDTTPSYLEGKTESNTVDLSTFRIEKQINDRIDKMGISLNDFRPIPVLGKIRAGAPMYMPDEVEEYTFASLPNQEEYFALRVVGDSMNAARIYDGDIVVVRRQNVAENGDIVVVLIDNEDATIKRIHCEGSIVTLIPQSTNPVYKPIVIDTKKTPFAVVGKVVKVEFKV